LTSLITIQEIKLTGISIMGRKSRSNILIDKAVQSALSAMELYNKPSYLYREESFAILMTNAWELLLKAKILENNNHNLTCLYIIDKNQKSKNGKPVYKENKSGTKKTIGITQAIKKVALPSGLQAQLETLIEIRNNSIHFYNDSKLFEQKLLEVGTATLKSFVEMLGEWFNFSLKKHKLFLIPLAFDIPEFFDANAIAKETDSHKKLLKYILEQEKQQEKNIDVKHNISLNVDICFSKKITGLACHSTAKDGVGIQVNYSNEDFKKKYPWEYKELIKRLKNNYSDFKQNSKFNEQMKILNKNEKYANVWHLNIHNKTGISKNYYSPNIVQEFDKIYTKKLT
jgi:hypothetical protein